MPAPIELLKTHPEQADLIRNLYQFYAYESSDWEQEDVEVDGRFYIHEPHLQRYWHSPGWGAHLVLVDGFIAGFVLIEASEVPGINALELADLFILKRYRRQGIGSVVAGQFLADTRTAWLLRYHAQDSAAAGFCQALLAGLARAFEEVALDDEPQLRNFLVGGLRH
ncbi:GNAT family N-acetyltransferase [Pseudomonas sp. SWRI107]|uniref:GNAT family N-acetyltransferase n=1 Tax=Pseudomonas farsensis TaxID=2745492 RepID=UPI0016461AFB|nr:GNAT family N-acetyltransferase [Pseudomonas farsensis]MBV4531160.1 GNAT family N-acetyltransferase [Pseudomonas farsensis]